MIPRIVIILLIVVLALPGATLTRPAASGPLSKGETAVAAKGKKAKNGKKSKGAVVTRTVRQPVTQTFTSSEPIAFALAGPGAQHTPASPYPAEITVSGFANGVISDVNLVLTDLSNSYAEDVSILLSTSDGRRAFVMSGIGGSFAVTDIDLVLDDEAAAAMPSGQAQLGSGTFQPTATILGARSMPAPAPTPDGNVALNTFDGADPNGTWQLWVMDAAAGDTGDLAGWALEITAEVDIEVKEPAQPKAKKDKKKSRKRR